MSLADTISVITVVQDSVPRTADFSTPMLAAYTAAFTGVKTYTADSAGLTAMVSDGLSTSSHPYRVLSAIVSQPVHCARLKVGAREHHSTPILKLTPTELTVGRMVSFHLEYLGTDHTVEYVVETGDVAGDIIAGLLTDAGVITGLTLANGTTTLDISQTVATSEERFYISQVTGLSVADATVGNNMAADLAAVLDLDSDWYGLLVDSCADADLEAAATFAAANGRLFGGLSPSADNLASNDGVAYTIRQLTNHRAYVVPTRDMQGHAEAALMGRQFSQPPGSSTWAHKTLTGPIADSYTAGQFAYARANGGLLYANDEGWSHTYDGVACSGRYLDITRGVDWVDSQIRSAMQYVLANAEKIPYTDSGAARFEAALGGVLQAGVTAGLFAPGWSVTRPKVADQLPVDRAARKFPNLRWTAQLAGAIHSLIPVSGTVIL